MAQHARLRVDTGLVIYFCDLHSSWQRGMNENTNGLADSSFGANTLTMPAGLGWWDGSATT